MMRTDGTGWTRRRLGLLLGLSQCKHLNILPAPVGGPGTAKRSTGHIYPAHRSEPDGLSLNNGRGRQETADPTDPPPSISFGPRGQTLAPHGTAPTTDPAPQRNSP